MPKLVVVVVVVVVVRNSFIKEYQSVSAGLQEGEGEFKMAYNCVTFQRQAMGTACEWRLGLNSSQHHHHQQQPQQELTDAIRMYSIRMPQEPSVPAGGVSVLHNTNQGEKQGRFCMVLLLLLLWLLGHLHVWLPHTKPRIMSTMGAIIC